MNSLRLEVLEGLVELNGLWLKPGDTRTVGADDLIRLGEKARCEFFVADAQGAKVTTAATLSKSSPQQMYTYTPPTYCSIPFYYDSSTRVNLCTQYGSPVIAP